MIFALMYSLTCCLRRVALRGGKFRILLCFQEDQYSSKTMNKKFCLSRWFISVLYLADQLVSLILVSVNSHISVWRIAVATRDLVTMSLLAGFFISENRSSGEDVHASCFAANTICLLGGLAHHITLSLQPLSDVVSRLIAVCLFLWGLKTGQCHLQDRRASGAARLKEPPGEGYILGSLVQWQCQNKQL